ncbi:MAG TPA: glycosyltransferase, partial [Halococcus sp.]|nr:glycosyltransferase [Halococcus sp.]
MSTICLLNALFPPESHGGAENYVLRTAKALQARGHEVTVVTTKPYDGLRSLRPEQTIYEGVAVWRFYPFNLSYRSNGTGENVFSKGIWHQLDTVNPHAAHTVGRILDSVNPDVVHTNNLMGISTSVTKAIERRETKHVHTLHDYSLICPKSNLLREWTAPDDELVVCEDPPVPCRLFAKEKRTLLGTPDVVTAPSQHVIDVHRKHGFFEGVKCRRVRLGVESVAENVPSSSVKSSVLYVGKHLRAKGLDTLFAAAQLLPDVTFHLCGKGPYAET